jgi:hypothetical protein
MSRSLAVVSLLVFAFGACRSGGSGSAADASLVVGVQSDDLGGLVTTVHLVVKQDGAVVDDEQLEPSPFAIAPKEVALQGALGARVDVSAEALGADGAPILMRTAVGHLVAPGKKLLRVHIERSCFSAPACAPQDTCVAGTCRPSEVSADALEDYESDWANAEPDVCRPTHHGDPEVGLGTGQTDYAALGDGQVLQLERGPQGGHHVWVAARMRNLKQNGTITSVASVIEGDPVPGPPFSVVFDYEPDEGGYCKLFGLRYQVDVGATDLANAYKRFLGKRLAVTLDVVDAIGGHATSSRTIQIADKVLCPDGTSTCDP